MGSPLPPCRCVGPASGSSRALPVPEGWYATRDPSTRPAISARHDTTVSVRAVWLCGVHPAKGGRSFSPASEYDLRPPPRGPCAAQDWLQGQHRAPASPHPSTSRHGFTDQGPQAPDPPAPDEPGQRGSAPRREAPSKCWRNRRCPGASRPGHEPDRPRTGCRSSFDAGLPVRAPPRRGQLAHGPMPGSPPASERPTRTLPRFDRTPQSAPRVPRATRRSPAVACRSSADAPCVACDAPRIQRREHTLQVR